MGLLERRREYVREKQRGSREEVLIEERTQKEKEEREQRKGVCVCVCVCVFSHLVEFNSLRPHGL